MPTTPPPPPTRRRRLNPFLQYPGGKRALADRVLNLLAPDGRAPTVVYEPFLGAGAVSLAALERWPGVRCVGSDASGPLVEVWQSVLQEPALVAAELAVLCAEPCTEAAYYELRAEYNAGGIPRHVKAALAIYLNRAGFNGLWRFNRRGELNVPWGKRLTVAVPDLREWGHLGRGGVFTVVRRSYADVGPVGPGDAVYLDPPYAPPANSDRPAPFTAYGAPDAGPWTMAHTFAVVDWATDAAGQGARVVLSHTEAPELNEKLLDLGWTIETLDVKRTISRNGATRAPVREILATIGGPQ